MGQRLSNSSSYVGFEYHAKEIRKWYIFVWHNFDNFSFKLDRTRIIIWCDENIKGLWVLNSGCIFFKNEEDLVAFKLWWV